MLLSHFYRELEKTAIIFEFLGKSFSNLEKLFLDRALLLKISLLRAKKAIYAVFLALTPIKTVLITCYLQISTVPHC